MTLLPLKPTILERIGPETWSIKSKGQGTLEADVSEFEVGSVLLVYVAAPLGASCGVEIETSSPDLSFRRALPSAHALLIVLALQPGTKTVLIAPGAVQGIVTCACLMAAGDAAVEAGTRELVEGFAPAWSYPHEAIWLDTSLQDRASGVDLKTLRRRAPGTRRAVLPWSLPLMSIRRKQVERRGGHDWESVGTDPQIIVSIKPLRPRFLAIAIETESEVEPTLFFHRGRGFHEADCVRFAPLSQAILLIAAGELRDVEAIRFDPMDWPGRFRLQVRSLGNARDVAVLGRTFFSGAGDSVPITTIGPPQLFAGLQASVAPRAARAMTAKDQFLHISALGAKAAASNTKLRHADVPLISIIVPVYNAPSSYLDQLLQAFLSQEVGIGELILVDDGSTQTETIAWLAGLNHAAIRVLRGPNGGISSAINRGLKQARGKWVAVHDHDDALAPHALALLRKTLDANPEALLVFTDEVACSESLEPSSIMLKPAFDPVLLTGVNYLNHFTLFKRERLEALGLEARSEFDGSQDYDLLLRYCRDLPGGSVLHMPYPAYLWRRTGKTYSATHIDAATAHARTALSEVYGAPVRPALVPTLHRIDFKTDPSALVSIIIPSKDHYTLIARTLHGLLGETSHSSIHVQVVDNGSTDPEVLALYEELRSKDRRFSAHVDPQPFNFARQVNIALSGATAPYVLLLNNDVEVIEPGWLTEMLSCFAFPDVGIVGARLLYPDRTLQHVGVGVGLGGLAGHPYLGKPATYYGEMNRLALRQTVSAVTGACMLISRACRERVGLLDEQRFAIAYNDVDYCLRAREAGFRTVFTPFATLIHHESASRGSDEKPETIERFRREQVALAERHATFSFRDPARSPWYSRATSQPTFQPLSKLPASS